VARAARAVTLDERRGAEVLQTRAGTRQRLAATVRTGTRMLPSNSHRSFITHKPAHSEKQAIFNATLSKCMPQPS